VDADRGRVGGPVPGGAERGKTLPQRLTIDNGHGPANDVAHGRACRDECRLDIAQCLAGLLAERVADDRAVRRHRVLTADVDGLRRGFHDDNLAERRVAGQ
jgi:hypothetical protein